MASTDKRIAALERRLSTVATVGGVFLFIAIALGTLGTVIAFVYKTQPPATITTAMECAADGVLGASCLPDPLPLTGNITLGGNDTSLTCTDNTTFGFECLPAIALDDLSDVIIEGPADGQVLTYNATTGAWVNELRLSTAAFGDNDTNAIVLATYTAVGVTNAALATGTHFIWCSGVYSLSVDSAVASIGVAVDDVVSEDSALTVGVGATNGTNGIQIPFSVADQLTVTALSSIVDLRARTDAGTLTVHTFHCQTLLVQGGSTPP